MDEETDLKVSHWLYHHGLYPAIALTILLGALTGVRGAILGGALWFLGMCNGAAVVGWKPYHEKYGEDCS